MKKGTLFGIFFIAFLIIPLTAAEVIDISSQGRVPVIIVETNDLALYTLNVTNNGNTDMFEIYSLVGVELKPSDKFNMEAGKTISLKVEARPNKRILDTTRGLFMFEYEIFSPSYRAVKSNLLMKLVSLKDVTEIKPTSIRPGDDSAKIIITNKEDIQLNDISFEFDSPLFKQKKILSVAPFEQVNVSIPLDQVKLKTLLAGTYPMTIMIKYHDADATIKPEIKYLERSGLSVAERNDGIVIRTRLIEKTNEGNVPTSAAITERRDILTRLLTSYNPRPDNATKGGFYMTYTWEEELQPGKTLSVTSTTNYTLPLTVIIIIVVVLVLVRFYSLTHISLTKRVHLVRTKGGEFALKVTLHVKARHTAENLMVNDRIPHSMKFYEKFGIKPDSLDEANRRVSWKISRLNAGEERVFSYIIYSKINVVGAFELPLAHVSYTRNGERKDVYSNKTSLATETISSD